MDFPFSEVVPERVSARKGRRARFAGATAPVNMDARPNRWPETRIPWS